MIPDALTKNTPVTAPSLHIFYDGGCKVCAWEVGKYLALDTRKSLGVIDINAPDFRAEPYGLDPVAVRKYFHVLTTDNRVISGVDAFIEIWKALDRPFSRRAARLARFAPVHAVLRAGYSLFVLVRPYLPRNAVNCDDGTCNLR
jgi:predicted DCC family thiol-disulfide oxidoreductase YuxK